MNLKDDKTTKDKYTGAARILTFDIETSHLKADFGTCFAIGYKWLHEDYVYCPAITDYEGWERDPTDCKKLLKDFASVWSQADVVVGYFSKGFDIKFLNAKMFEYGLPPLTPVAHIDLFFVVKAAFALSRKSLQNVAYHGNLEGRKTPVEGRIWRRASTGHGPSIKYIVDHCLADVQMTEELYLKLRPYIKQHPRVSGYGPCRTCGSTALVSRGYAVTKLRGEQRKVQCNSCGSWDQRPVK